MRDMHTQARGFQLGGHTSVFTLPSMLSRLLLILVARKYKEITGKDYKDTYHKSCIRQSLFMPTCCSDMEVNNSIANNDTLDADSMGLYFYMVAYIFKDYLTINIDDIEDYYALYDVFGNKAIVPLDGRSINKFFTAVRYMYINDEVTVPVKYADRLLPVNEYREEGFIWKTMSYNNVHDPRIEYEKGSSPTNLVYGIKTEAIMRQLINHLWGGDLSHSILSVNLKEYEDCAHMLKAVLEFYDNNEVRIEKFFAAYSHRYDKKVPSICLFADELKLYDKDTFKHTEDLVKLSF